MQKPYNTPKKPEKQVETIDSKEIKNQRRLGSYADSKVA
jgi:hypothetical protein